MAQTKKISFRGCSIMKPKQAWQQNKKTGKPYLRSGIVGRVTRNASAFISSTNRSGQNPQYVRDSSVLTDAQKGELIRIFDVEERPVAYIYDPAVATKKGGPRTMSGSSQAVKKPARRTTKGGF